MSTVRVHITFEAKDPAKVKESTNAVLDATKKAKGCIQFDVYQDMKEANKFAFIGIWETKEDLDNHHKSDVLKEFMAGAKGKVEPPVAAIYKPF